MSQYGCNNICVCFFLDVVLLILCLLTVISACHACAFASKIQRRGFTQHPPWCRGCTEPSSKRKKYIRTLPIVCRGHKHVCTDQPRGFSGSPRYWTFKSILAALSRKLAPRNTMKLTTSKQKTPHILHSLSTKWLPVFDPTESGVVLCFHKYLLFAIHPYAPYDRRDYNSCQLC